MQIYQNQQLNQKWKQTLEPRSGYNLVMVFIATSAIKPEVLIELKKAFPGAFIAGCSTAGEIFGSTVSDNSISITAIKFENSSIKTVSTDITDPDKCFEAGVSIGRQLDHENLRHVLVFSEGLHVNGSELVMGINNCLPETVLATGGLAADGDTFNSTYIIWDAQFKQKTVGAIGFYGDSIKIGHGSIGGWDTFGPDRKITRSTGNILYEIDGQSALQLYKKYLGPQAKNLPASALLFPLQLKTGGKSGPVRTVLGIDEKNQSMTFAGDMPEGALACLMKANFDRLIDGATEAARGANATLINSNPQLAVLISCVGRKLVLKQRIEEEVEAVAEVLGNQTKLCGFYSYGEISPMTANNNHCELHNQTMTITTFSE